MELQIRRLRAQVEAANDLIGLLIGNLERCAPYNLIMTIEGEMNEIRRANNTDELTQSETEVKRAFIEHSLKLGSSLKYKPFRIN